MDITLLNVLQWPVYFISLYFSVFWMLVYLEGREEPSLKRLRRLPKVTIAVPAYNEEDTISTTLDSLRALDYPADKLQIIVINDGSTDKTKERIQPYLKHKHFTLLDQKNTGKGKALNNAIKRASGEYFVVLDADSEVKSDTLKILLRHFTSDDIAVVIPVMKIKQRAKLTLLQKLQWYEYLVNVFFKRVMADLDCVHVAPGPFSVYKLDAIKAVGLFAEDNITEDLELTLRMQRNNYRIVQSMEGEVYTNAMPTLKSYFRQRNRWFKGGVLSALQYRDMMFNPKWGDFGIMQLPILIVSGVISITLIGTLLYESLSPVIKQALQMNLVHFDFMTFIRTFTLDIHPVDFSAANIMLWALMLGLSMLILGLATYHTKERIFTYSPLVVMSYVFLYFFLLALTWVDVIKDLAFRKVQKW